MTIEKKAPKKASAATWVGWIGGLTTALGIYLLARRIPTCGSVLKPDLLNAELLDITYKTRRYTQDCLDQLDTATVPAWVVTCVGLLLIITAIIVAVIAKRPPAAPVMAPAAAPSLTGELENLAALKNNGVITEEEFQQSKAALLARHNETQPPSNPNPGT